MHKFFAKPILLGKKLVFLPQCHSTNDELSKLVRNESAHEGTVVYTDHQIKGKGQRGNKWLDEPGKNLLCSVLLQPHNLQIDKQYYLNIVVGLAVTDVIKMLLPAKVVKLKWPNDVYVDSQKIAGILIENNIKGNKIEWSISGIGINVNQHSGLPTTATSLIIESDMTTDRLMLMEEIIAAIEYWNRKLVESKYHEILSCYYELLYWKDEPHSFYGNSKKFDGIIRGIDRSGRLIIDTNTGTYTFAVKEVQFIE